MDTTKILNNQILVTSFILFFAVIVFEYSNIDIWVEDYFYNFESRQWLINRHDEMTKRIFYDNIKALLVVFALLLITGLLSFRTHPLIKINQQGLLIVCLSAILVPLVVGILKAVTNIPCPNDISHYGGNYPYVTLFKGYPLSFFQTENIRCYPAGHASGGFAFLSLFFLFNTRKNKIIALSTAMALGWTMGLYKMLIGDHFLGHTVVTMLLAWLIILIVAKTISSIQSETTTEPLLTE